MHTLSSRTVWVANDDDDKTEIRCTTHDTIWSHGVYRGNWKVKRVLGFSAYSIYYRLASALKHIYAERSGKKEHILGWLFIDAHFSFSFHDSRPRFSLTYLLIFILCIINTREFIAQPEITFPTSRHSVSESRTHTHTTCSRTVLCWPGPIANAGIWKMYNMWAWNADMQRR